jgi:hypothetical protein
VQSFYQNFLGRQGEASGVAGWVSALQLGASEEDVALLFLTSPEYNALHADNTDFVQSLYRNVLGREGETSGVQSYVNSLNGGESRASVAATFLHSTEEDLRAVDSFYAVFLARQGDSGGVNGWVTSLQNGSETLADVAQAFLSTQEFINRAGQTVS